MLYYTISQWLFFFYFYCFFGWIFESAYVSILKRKWVNRGFMRGPFLPIYGSGAVMMLIVSMPFRENLLLTYLAGCLGATLLELVTGVAMEAFFKVRYWDYSNQKFNYKGHICLSTTAAWGFLTIFMTQFLHKGVEKIVFLLPHPAVLVVTIVVTCYLIVDVTLSVKAALDLRDILAGMDKARKEMEHIQKRLDVMIAVVSEEIEIKKQVSEMRMEELMDVIEAKFYRIRDRIKLNSSDVMDDIREEISELRSKYLIQKERRMQSKRLKDFYQRNMIKGNPSMYSAKFNEALEELKKAVSERKKK